MNRRGFFAAMVAIPGAVKAGKRPGPGKRLKYVLNLRYGKFAEPSPDERALIDDCKRHNAEIERQAYYGSRAEFFLAT